MSKPLHTALTEGGEPESQRGKPPVDKFHEGRVHVSIFKNESSKGDFHTASFQLRYKDKNEQFQTGHSYGKKDCEDLARAAAQAEKRIETLDKAKEQSRGGRGE